MLVDSPLSRAFGKGFLALRDVRHTFEKASRVHLVDTAFDVQYCVGKDVYWAVQIALSTSIQVVSGMKAFSSTE
jgi:hypothetical protein